MSSPLAPVIETFVADFLVDSPEDDKITLDLEVEHCDADYEIIVNHHKFSFTVDQARMLAEALQVYLE